MRLPLFVASAFAFIGASKYAAATSLVGRQSRTAPLLGAFPGQAVLPTLAQILNFNATNGTLLPLENIQGDILIGMKKQKERFIFFQINDAVQFKNALKTYAPHITSTATLISPPAQQPLAFVNLAFSNTGLRTLGITDNLGDQQFSSGMFADAQNLKDDLGQWAPPFTSTSIHGVFLMGSDQDTFIDQSMDDMVSTFGTSITALKVMSGSARPGNQAGHEHFGYLDGISQPAITGWAMDVLPGQSIIPTGVILTGRLGDLISRPAWAVDGSFMVFRHLQQKVPEFTAYTRANALARTSAGIPLTTEQGAEFLGARMFGRWKSGAPLVRSPNSDDPTLGADPLRNNDFQYENALLDEIRCPFTAHIREMRPRLDLADAAVSNQAIRSSIPYGPETSDAELASGVSAQDRGLLFVEYQSTIALGFRFQQTVWANDPLFPPGKPKLEAPGLDPIIGQGNPRDTTGLDPLNPLKTFALPSFVVPKGGEYFFMPSIPALISTIAN